LEEKTALILPEYIKLNSFERKKHRIYLDDEKFAFADTEISLSHISDLKFGLKMMQFHLFSLGRKYSFSVKSLEKEIELVFKSYFGLGNNYFDTLYHQILDAVWDRVADRLLAEKIQELKSEKGLSVGNCVIRTAGITIYQQSFFSEKAAFISWQDLTYKKNYNRLSVYSKTNSQIWTNLFFTENWNVEFLMHILDWLYEQNGLAELKTDKTDQ